MTWICNTNCTSHTSFFDPLLNSTDKQHQMPVVQCNQPEYESGELWTALSHSNSTTKLKKPASQPHLYRKLTSIINNVITFIYTKISIKIILLTSVKLSVLERIRKIQTKINCNDAYHILIVMIHCSILKNTHQKIQKKKKRWWKIKPCLLMLTWSLIKISWVSEYCSVSNPAHWLRTLRGVWLDYCSLQDSLICPKLSQLRQEL